LEVLVNLDFTPEEIAFRDRARTWLRENVPAEKRPFDGVEQRAFDRAWQLKQYEGGWAGVSWPKEYGGRGLSLVQQLIWHEEYAMAGAPSSVSSTYVGLSHAGPTLIARGTDTQKAFHLEKILTGEATWCQGFSEPGAGSDLASLRTSGVVDGDHLVINGQKIWTSFAHLTDYQELLIRTGKGEKKHWGLTWIIGKMTLPGVDIRPIKTITGDHHFSEVFYDNVRIPLSNVVGEVNDGWSVAMTTLGFERGTASITHQIELARFIEELISLAAETTRKGRPLLQYDDVRLKLAEIRAEVAGLRALTYATVSRAIREDGPPGAEGSIVRLFHTELLKKATRLAMDMLRPEALGQMHRWNIEHEYLDAFSATIAGGSSEIQRNIIGERALGLPRDR
jgi:alkylation response protein AidB-like acyl-CoA dehydrogenase